MKKLLVTMTSVMVFVSSSWAAETVNIHDQVNNAQAPMHQMQSSSENSETQGDSMKMMDMDGHAQAGMSHEMMNNGNSVAHQNMAEMHKKMMKARHSSNNGTAKSFSAMNEHERAAVVHESVNNGPSSAMHQQQAEEHLNQLPQN